MEKNIFLILLKSFPGIIATLVGFILNTYAQPNKPIAKSPPTKSIQKVGSKLQALKIKSYHLKRLDAPESMDANFEYDSKGRLIKYTEVWQGERTDWKNKTIQLSYDDPQYIFQKLHTSEKDEYYLYVLNSLGYVEKVFRRLYPDYLSEHSEKFTYKEITLERELSKEYDNFDFKYNSEGHLVQTPIVTLTGNLNGIRQYEISNSNVVRIISKFPGYRSDIIETTAQEQTYSDEELDPYNYYIYAIIDNFAQCPFGNSMFFNFLLPEKYGIHSKNIWTGPLSRYDRFTGRPRPLLEGSGKNSFCNIIPDKKTGKSFVVCKDPEPEYQFNFEIEIQHHVLQLTP